MLKQYFKTKNKKDMTFKTADLCDANPNTESINIVDNIGFKDYGGNSRFYGNIQTLKCFEDHSWVEKMLSEDGTGKVLVVDGGGSLKCAILGDRLASLAIKNNWNGVVVYGAIRDSVTISKLPIGVKALGTYPISNTKDTVWQKNIGIEFAGTYFWSDQYIYCDEDGMITSRSKLI